MTGDTHQQQRLDAYNEAISSVRDALAGVNSVPAASLSNEQHGALFAAEGKLAALEGELVNERDQARESYGGGGE